MFDLNGLGRLPEGYRLPDWADYVELRCLLDLDGHYSADRLATAMRGEADFTGSLVPDDAQRDDATAAQADSVEELLEAVTDDELLGGDAELDDVLPVEVVPASPVEELLELTYGRAAEEFDSVEEYAERVFAVIASRAERLSELYPFKVDSANREVSLAFADSHAHKHYVFYLASSLLRYVKRTDAIRLTGEFEILSVTVMRKLLGEAPEIDLYGTARRGLPSRFTGGPFERLEALAKALRGKVGAEEGDFHPRDSADNGLDIVAWFPMADEAKGVPVLFAQCACGIKWEYKQYEASWKRWKEFLSLASAPIEVVLVPHMFRSTHTRWYVDTEVSGVLIDRERALKALQRTDCEEDLQVLVNEIRGSKEVAA
ncbi:MAG: hypothetical protein AB7H92_07765 [Microbacteriaceae bacterium]